MNVLLVTWFFPPGNDVAALRTGAMARFFLKKGHRIRVLTSARVHADESLDVPLPREDVYRTTSIDIDHPFRPVNLTTIAKTPASSSDHSNKSITIKTGLRGVRALLSSTYVNLSHVPDGKIGWFPSAVIKGRRILGAAPSDVIYASGPPFTTFLVARSLAQRFGIPWVAEYRDAWCHYLYEPRPRWRQALDARIERSVVLTSAAIVAVTDPWAEHFRERFGKPTVAIYNGYDSAIESTAMREAACNEPVSVAYLGNLYTNVRNPALLYEAIRMSGLTSDELQVTYYGPCPSEVYPLAEKHGVGAYVRTNPRVPIAQSFRIQRDSDILLLLQSPDDPRNIPAKLFEYLASRRPILGIGLDCGLPAKLITERQAGHYTSAPSKIAEQLRLWVWEKRQTGSIADTPVSSLVGLAREEQLLKLESFLKKVI